MSGLRRSEVRNQGVLRVGFDGQRTVRWAGVDLTGPLREACRRLDLSPVAAGALGRLLAGAVLVRQMSAARPSWVVLGFSGDGPLSRVVAEVSEKGEIRGTVSEPRLELPVGDPSELGVGRALGDGVLQVLRKEEGITYQSLVEVPGGRIGKALTEHLHQSDETRSAALLGVLALPEGVAAAGGILLEVLPSLEEAALRRLEERLRGLGSIGRTLSAGGLAMLLEAVLPGTDLAQAESSEIRYVCRCRRHRIYRYLSGFEAGELEELRADSGMLEVECVFCGARYLFEWTEFGAGRVN